jgi:hypothetical protein
MTDGDRAEYEKDAGAGFPPTHPMTPAESANYNLMARRIYIGLKSNREIKDRKEKREQREFINNDEVDLTYELMFTHGFQVGDEKAWDDGFRVQVVDQKVPERGEEKSPTIKVIYEEK